MKKSRVLLTAAASILAVAGITACGQKSGKVKIGVIRADAVSGEAVAWEQYLKTVGGELGYDFEFATTDDAAAEKAAVETFASKGAKAVMMFSANDKASAAKAANKAGIYYISPTGDPTEAERTQIESLPYYLGSISPKRDQDYNAGYNLARHFVTNLEKTNFTIFGGATLYASEMHVDRLVGMLAYLCEDAGTDYDGVTTRGELIGKVIGQGVDTSKFHSTKYTISGYMQEFKFDDAFITTLTNSLTADGTGVMCVGATDTVTRIASGIAAGLGKSADLKTGGVDALTESYLESFDSGYSYDAGKYASCMAPALALIHSALNGNVIKQDGKGVFLASDYWTVTTKAELQDVINNDSVGEGKNGYMYDAKVIKSVLADANPLTKITELASATYSEAKAIHAATR